MIKDVPASELREHIAELVDAGWKLKAIGRQAGLDQRIVSRIYNGKAIWASQHTADAIRSVSKFSEAECLRVGVVRRLDDLMLSGWWDAEIERQLGVRVGYCHDLRRGMTVRPSKLPALRAFAERLDRVSGPPLTGTWHRRRDASAAKYKADRLGALPALVWDDIDDPAERPKRKRGQDMFNAPDRASIVRRRLNEGATVRQAALDAGVSERTAQRLKKTA